MGFPIPGKPWTQCQKQVLAWCNTAMQGSGSNLVIRNLY